MAIAAILKLLKKKKNNNNKKQKKKKNKKQKKKKQQQHTTPLEPEVIFSRNYRGGIGAILRFTISKILSQSISNMAAKAAILKFFKGHLLPNWKLDWAEIWLEASGQHRGSE